MKIYLHQTEIKPDSSINIQNLYDVFENNLQADLIVCPEVFTSGFKYNQIEDISRENKDILKKIQYMCSSSKTAFLGSFLWKDGTNYFNRAFFIDELGGILAYYDKHNLIPAFNEQEYLKPGSKISVFTFKGMRIGLAICYDLRFPELFRKYAAHEVDIIFLVAQWPEERLEHFITLARARAIENQCYFIAVNAVGKSSKIQMGGHSMAINPKGEFILDLKKSKNGNIIQVHLYEVLKWRAEFSALYQYSRPALFSAKLLRWFNK
jgi:predicted amidohydrolase